MLVLLFSEMHKQLQLANFIFVSIFVVEIMLRLTAMGKSFFMVPWNIFDFLIILTSAVGTTSSLLVLSRCYDLKPFETI